MAEHGDGARAHEDSRHDETPKERVTRKWGELLQELRVAQMGVQILTGFLLTVPFSARFAELSQVTRTAFLVTVSMAVLSAVMLIAPVAFHRVLYGRSEKRWLLATAAHLARMGLAFLGLTLVGVMFMTFEVVAGGTPAIVAAVVAFLLVAGLWWLTPWTARGAAHDRPDG